MGAKSGLARVWKSPRAAPISVGVVVCAATLSAGLLAPDDLRERGRERTFDLLLAASRPLRTAEPRPLAPLIVVEIDPASIAAVGAWPWRRSAIARLLRVLSAVKPSVIGVDILFGGPDARSPAALARRLADQTNRKDLRELADTLDDDDKQLAEAVASAPVALGFALDPNSSERPPGAPISVETPLSDAALWQAKGVVLPPAAVVDAASGLGALPLLGDSDGVVRRAPALVAAAGALQPGLALETLRLALAEPAFQVAAQPEALDVEIGTYRLRLPHDGLIRLAPDVIDRAPARVVSAASLLAGTAAPLPERAIVWVGVSAAEANGLRASAAGPLTASVRLQAAALHQLRVGFLPSRSRAWDKVMALLTSVVIVGALWTGAARPPGWSVAAGAGGVAGLWATGLFLAGRGVLWDPTLASLLALFAALAPASLAAARTFRREQRIRRRFEQVLPPAIVARIAADPRALRLAGERRVVTALFTDIEGFTSLTSRIGSQELVRLLDGYFEGATQLILKHGGMVDKFVGDGVLAFFGMPLELQHHPQAAVRCAVDLLTWTEQYRRGPEAASLGLGRTRIGVETGEVIAGEVGRGAKLSYTAYGEAVNLAARLEAANKRLNTTICVGPAAARACPASWLRPAARIALQGIAGEVEAWTPWPLETGEAWRVAYRRAWERAETDFPGAARDFEALGCALLADPTRIQVKAATTEGAPASPLPTRLPSP